MSPSAHNKPTSSINSPKMPITPQMLERFQVNTHSLLARGGQTVSARNNIPPRRPAVAVAPAYRPWYYRSDQIWPAHLPRNLLLAENQLGSLNSIQNALATSHVLGLIRERDVLTSRCFYVSGEVYFELATNGYRVLMHLRRLTLGLHQALGPKWDDRRRRLATRALKLARHLMK